MQPISEIVAEAREIASAQDGACLTFGTNRFGDELLIVTARAFSRTYLVRGNVAVLLDPIDKDALDRAREAFRCPV
ncbi:MAG: hypothetical protein PBV01_11500 [Brucella anthropi]